MSNRRQHLGGANVRSAEHPDFAIGIRQRRRPLDRVITVVGFVLERVPLAFGGVAAAHVLKNDHKAARSALQAEIHAIVFVIRRALQQHRELAVGGGTVNIGSKRHAIAHLHGDIPLICDLVPVRCLRQRGTEKKGKKQNGSKQGCAENESLHMAGLLAGLKPTTIAEMAE